MLAWRALGSGTPPPPPPASALAGKARATTAVPAIKSFRSMSSPLSVIVGTRPRGRPGVARALARSGGLAGALSAEQDGSRPPTGRLLLPSPEPRNPQQQRREERGERAASR